MMKNSTETSKLKLAKLQGQIKENEERLRSLRNSYGDNYEEWIEKFSLLLEELNDIEEPFEKMEHFLDRIPSLISNAKDGIEMEAESKDIEKDIKKLSELMSKIEAEQEDDEDDIQDSQEPLSSDSSKQKSSLSRIANRRLADYEEEEEEIPLADGEILSEDELEEFILPDDEEGALDNLEQEEEMPKEKKVSKKASKNETKNKEEETDDDEKGSIGIFFKSFVKAVKDIAND